MVITASWTCLGSRQRKHTSAPKTQTLPPKRDLNHSQLQGMWGFPVARRRRWVPNHKNGSGEPLIDPPLSLVLFSWEIWLTGSLVFLSVFPFLSPPHLLRCVALPFLHLPFSPSCSALISVSSRFCLSPSDSKRAHQLHRHVWDAETHVPTSRPWKEMPCSRCL